MYSVRDRRGRGDMDRFAQSKYTTVRLVQKMDVDGRTSAILGIL